MLDNRYNTLIVLAETLSYTKTAQKLFITQPAVSQQIKSLENDLNLQLVITNKRRIILTEAGFELVRYASQIKVESQKLLQKIKSTIDEPSLKLGCTLSLSSTLLPQFISRVGSHSKLIASEISNTETILKALRNGSIDFGLVEGNFNKAEFDSIKIKEENFICVAHGNVQNTNQNIQNLLQENLFVREKGSGSRAIFENWLGTQNLQLQDFQQLVEIASPTVIVQLLEQTSGISFVYESLVKKAIQNNKLTQINLNNFQISHPINLVFLKNSYFVETYQNLVDIFHSH